jgi:hypothetical protein
MQKQHTGMCKSRDLKILREEVQIGDFRYMEAVQHSLLLRSRTRLGPWDCRPFFAIVLNLFQGTKARKARFLL